MKSPTYGKRLKEGRDIYYGWQLRKLLEAAPEKFAWGRAALFTIPLAMLGGLGVAAFSYGLVRMGAALFVMVLGVSIPIVARLTR